MNKMKIILIVLLFSLPKLIFSQIPDTEKKALISLYKATSGESWANNTNWDLTKSASEINSNWYGLFIEDGHVVHIKLSKNNLTGFIPLEIENLKYLKHLDFAGNQLYGGLPKTIGNLNQLEFLSIANNYLSGSIPKEIGNLSSLKELNLSKNEFTCGIPSEIGNLSKLERIQIFNVPLGGAIPEEIGKLQNLEMMYIGNCNFAGEIPKTIGNLTKLKVLWLSENELQGTIPKEIGSLTKLEDIRLTNNQLSGSIIHLTKLKNLRGLMIQKNNFTYESLELAIPYLGETLKDGYNLHYFDQAKINASQTSSDGKIVLNAYTPGKKNSYQWYKDGVEIEGQTNTKLIISNPKAEAGIYVCKIQNSSVPNLVLETQEIRIK